MRGVSKSIAPSTASTLRPGWLADDLRRRSPLFNFGGARPRPTHSSADSIAQGVASTTRPQRLLGLRLRHTLAFDALATMVHAGDSDAPGVATFGLPFITLCAESLELTQRNGPATRVLELEGVQDGFTAVDLFRGPAQAGDGGEADLRVREGLEEYLIGLARRSMGLAWGETIQLDFFTRRGRRRRADVVVALSSSTDNAATLSILFIRPILVDPAQLSSDLQSLHFPPSSSPAIPSSPRSTGLTSPPTPNPPFSFPQHLDSSSSLSSSGRSASFSSSNSRPTRRVAVGEERAKLPLEENLKSMLQHATSRLTDTKSRTASLSSDLASPSTPPTSAPSSSTSPSAPSTSVIPPSTSVIPPSPIVPSDPPQPTAASERPPGNRRTPSGSKLPASVEGLTGRRQSFDQALVTLSQKTDGTARTDGQTFFRLPINEIDAGGNDLSPWTEEDDPLAGLVGPSPACDDLSQATPAEDAALLETARAEAAKKRARDVRPPLSLAQLTNMVEHNPHMCFIADPDGQVVWLNSTWYEYTGGGESRSLSVRLLAC